MADLGALAKAAEAVRERIGRSCCWNCSHKPGEMVCRLEGCRVDFAIHSAETIARAVLEATGVCRGCVAPYDPEPVRWLNPSNAALQRAGKEA